MAGIRDASDSSEAYNLTYQTCPPFNFCTCCTVYSRVNKESWEVESINKCDYHLEEEEEQINKANEANEEEN